MPKSIVYLLLIFLVACQQQETPNPYYNGIEDIQQEKAFLMEVVHPAGANTGSVFLPYPANHGVFTENSALEVLTITGSLEKGKTVAVTPIATLLLTENQAERTIIIATPLDTALQVLPPSTFQNFSIAQAGMKQILQNWFLYEKGLGTVDLVGWKDEQYAWKRIKNE